MFGRDAYKPPTLSPLWKRAALALVILLWDGIPLTLFGFWQYDGKHAAAAIILATFALPILTGKMIGIDRWVVLPFVAFFWFLAVTMVSSSYIFPQPIGDWAFASYSIVPLGLIVLIRQLDLTFEDMLSSILIVGGVVSVLVIADQALHLPFGEKYIRASTTDLVARRTVILKTEMSMGTVIAYVNLLRAPNLKLLFRWAVVFFLFFGLLFFVMESRLTLAAILASITIITLVAVLRTGSGRALVFAIAGFLVFVPLLIQRFFGSSASTLTYVQEDTSIQWRLITVRYYNEIFSQTNGLGFGVMSTSQSADNPLSFGQLRQGARYGHDNYNLYLADTGIFSALFQFGYLGLIVVVLMSAIAVWSLIRKGRGTSSLNAEIAFGLGLLMLFYILSPWPINFFSLEWSIMAGAVFWCLASTYTTRIQFRTR